MCRAPFPTPSLLRTEITTTFADGSFNDYIPYSVTQPFLSTRTPLRQTPRDVGIVASMDFSISNEVTVESHLTTITNLQNATEKPRTPTLVSPPGSHTPPTVAGKRDYLTDEVANNGQRVGSEPVDAEALTRALVYEQAGRQRERTPGGSPSRKRQRVYGDR